MNPKDLLETFDPSDWLAILNLAIQTGGLDSLTVSREVTDKWLADPLYKPYLRIEHSAEGGFIFIPVSEPHQPLISMAPTLN